MELIRWTGGLGARGRKICLAGWNVLYLRFYDSGASGLVLCSLRSVCPMLPVTD